MEKILIGNITGAFGIKGELKVLSDFEMPEKAFKKNNLIYLNNDKHIITGVRFHKNKYLLEIDNLKDINLIEQFRGSKVYIDYETLSLTSDEYLLIELLNLDVYNEDKLVGKVTGISNNKQNVLIKVNNKFYIPLKGNFIKTVNKNEKKIYCQNLEGLII